ncbi:beta-N-acetylhexosaminidase [Alistipes sp.]|uniref:beta-N-acetylhexosaminidase n=1 Tax=Alistipes sp. TaxID=1872444 RepID=UPI003AEF7D53
MNRICLFLCAALFAGCCGRVVPASEEIAVIPRPAGIECGEGFFTLRAATPVRLSDPSLETACEAWTAVFREVFSRKPELHAAEPADGAVNFALCDTLAPEAYRLEINPQRIEIHAGDAAGALHAVQSLRQLLPAEVYGAGRIRAVELPAVVISDRPAMAYRGLMLDVARHFFTVDEVKRTLDLMALHKLNVFHWHLTDDQGWRIEIRKYPELTRIGSVRKRTLIGKDPGGEYDETTRYDGTPHGGYYTQDEIREVVGYAARRGITIIPEIEFPGHAVAALASYPSLGCTGERFAVRETWDIDDRVFCVGREETFRFIEEVLAEVAELFPSRLIHIGGDECPTKAWARCPHCRARMRAEGLTHERQLQGYATARIERFLQQHGRTLIGWDEILDGGVTPSSVVMSWRGTEGGVRAARQGNRVVMAPTDYCYFDYYQTADTTGEPLAWGGCLPVQKVYAFDPYAGLTAAERACVLGVQANLWTEYIADFRQVQYMLLPRLAALCEVGWCGSGGDYPEFLRRLERLRGVYDAEGYVYARHVFAQ